jgi:rhodanese-related sulfurtransferase
MPVWKKNGNLILSETAALMDFMKKDIAHVLIDLRESKAAEKGFIPGAVSIPTNELASAKEKFLPTHQPRSSSIPTRKMQLHTRR